MTPADRVDIRRFRRIRTMRVVGHGFATCACTRQSLCVPTVTGRLLCISHYLLLVPHLLWYGNRALVICIASARPGGGRARFELLRGCSWTCVTSQRMFIISGNSMGLARDGVCSRARLHRFMIGNFLRNDVIRAYLGCSWCQITGRGGPAKGDILSADRIYHILQICRRQSARAGVPRPQCPGPAAPPPPPPLPPDPTEVRQPPPTRRQKITARKISEQTVDQVSCGTADAPPHQGRPYSARHTQGGSSSKATCACQLGLMRIRSAGKFVGNAAAQCPIWT